MEQRGYHVIWNAAERPGYSGTAVLTKQKPIDVQLGIGATADDEGRVITCEYDDFFFVTVYTPNSKNDLSRLPYRYDEWDTQSCEQH